VIVVPGLQKLAGWFGGLGLAATAESLAAYGANVKFRMAALAA
jgi:hypothetical protein